MDLFFDFIQAGKLRKDLGIIFQTYAEYETSLSKQRNIVAALTTFFASRRTCKGINAHEVIKDAAEQGNSFLKLIIGFIRWAWDNRAITFLYGNFEDWAKLSCTYLIDDIYKLK